MKEIKKRKYNFRFEVANLITEARYHYKLTQAQLARKMGTQQPSIARIESGNTLPSLSFLERLADSLGTYLTAPKFGFMENSGVQITSTRQSSSRSGSIPGYFNLNPDSLLLTPLSLITSKSDHSYE